MSILIKGLKMPEDGEFLDLVITADGVVRAYDQEDEKIAEAVELPDHGDLLDKDELSRLVGESFEYFLARLSLKCPKAVIPAERSEDGKYKI